MLVNNLLWQRTTPSTAPTGSIINGATTNVTPATDATTSALQNVRPLHLHSHMHIRNRVHHPVAANPITPLSQPDQPLSTAGPNEAHEAHHHQHHNHVHLALPHVHHTGPTEKLPLLAPPTASTSTDTAFVVHMNDNRSTYTTPTKPEQSSSGLTTSTCFEKNNQVQPHVHLHVGHHHIHSAAPLMGLHVHHSHTHTNPCP